MVTCMFVSSMIQFWARKHDKVQQISAWYYIVLYTVLLYGNTYIHCFTGINPLAYILGKMVHNEIINGTSTCDNTSPDI